MAKWSAWTKVIGGVPLMMRHAAFIEIPISPYDGLRVQRPIPRS